MNIENTDPSAARFEIADDATQAGFAIASDTHAKLHLPASDGAIVFAPCISEEVMRLDKDGMTYKGQRIEDAGEAHRAFLAVMNRMSNTP